MRKQTISVIMTVCMASAILMGCGNAGKMEGMAAENTKSENDLAVITDADPEEYIRIPDISSITVAVDPPQHITEENVEEELESYEASLWELRTVEGRDTVQDGDIVNVSYEAIIGGRRLQEYDENECNMVIGSKNPSDGFEDELVGMRVGEEKAIQFTYPEDYYDSNVAGQDAVFTVRLNSIQYYYKPELTDESVKDMKLTMEDGATVETVDGLRAYIREYLTKMVSENYVLSCQAEALDALCQNVTVLKPYTDEMREAALNSILGDTGMSRENISDEDADAMKEYVNDFITERLCIKMLSKDRSVENAYDAERAAAADYILSHAKVVEQ